MLPDTGALRRFAVAATSIVTRHVAGYSPVRAKGLAQLIKLVQGSGRVDCDAASHSHPLAARAEWAALPDTVPQSILFRYSLMSHINRRSRRCVENSSGHSVRRPYEPQSA
jgi:hypothetical protein